MNRYEHQHAKIVCPQVLIWAKVNTKRTSFAPSVYFHLDRIKAARKNGELRKCVRNRITSHTSVANMHLSQQSMAPLPVQKVRERMNGNTSLSII